MFEVITAFAIIPFALMADWFAFLRQLPGLQMEITRASHGAVMVLVAATLAYWHLADGDPLLVPSGYQQYILPALGFIGVWGLFWLFVGAARSRHFRDHHLLGRAAMKVILGGGVWYVAHDWPRHDNWQMFSRKVAMMLAAWCLITGLTKVILLLRPLPRLDDNATDPWVHGDSDFSDGLR